MCILSGLAGGAVSARDQRKYCRLLAYEALVVRVDDLARELVPRNGRKMVCAFLEYTRNVTSADTARVHFHKHFARFSHWSRDVLVSEVAHGVKIQCFHQKLF